MSTIIVMLLFILSALISGRAMADENESEYMFLQAKHSGKCAQVDEASNANGANISQWDCLNQDNVKWKWIKAGGGYVFLKAQHSGKCAQVNEASSANGASITQWDCVDQDNVKWAFRVVERSNGAKYYNIVNKASGKCMQVNEASMVNHASISQWDCVNQDNVKWRLFE